MPQIGINSMLYIAVAGFLIWAGISILLAVKRINDTYVLSPNRLIYPANYKPELCKDPAGCIAFITPRIIIFAVAALLISCLLILQGFTGFLTFLPDWLESRIAILLFIPFFIWYVIFINKAAKAFW